MKRESALILNTAGVLLDWRIRGEDASDSNNDLVVIAFKGACDFVSAPSEYNEAGPLALTFTANGEMQPFGEVDCNHVVNSARKAMPGNNLSRGDLLIGRAMGRVIAHELVHMLTKSGQHGTEGVEQPSLSGKQLIEDYLPLSAFDINRLKQEFRYRSAGQGTRVYHGSDIASAGFLPHQGP
ncbi:MAG: hypothetical protein ABSB15_08815 [Bryobacteraceae bacterium]|jgi:hypothetical protein